MTASPERIAANQANSQRSTGPRTDAGKLASRGNAFKHGLTGAGLALPDEDAAEVDAAFHRHLIERNPRTQAGLDAVFRIALCTLRLERFATAEHAILSQRIIDAGFAFDDAQVARRDECRARLYKDPEAQLKVLSRFAVGVQWVVDAWDALGFALSTGRLKNWKQPQFTLLEALSGHPPEYPSYSDSTLFALAAMGDEGALDNPDLEGKSPADRCQSARDQLMAICDQEKERWEGLLAPASAATAIARANAIQAARYDGSKEGLLAKKYEAATVRELAKARKDFEAAEAAEVEAASVVENPVQQEACVELASFFPIPEPVATAPTSASSADPIERANLAQTDSVPTLSRGEVAHLIGLTPPTGRRGMP